MNWAQLSTVEKLMSGKTRENVALLQGPPGKVWCSLVAHRRTNRFFSLATYSLSHKFTPFESNSPIIVVITLICKRNRKDVRNHRSRERTIE